MPARRRSGDDPEGRQRRISIRGLRPIHLVSLSLLSCMITFPVMTRDWSATLTPTPDRSVSGADANDGFLYLAINSAPKDFYYRSAARATFLQRMLSSSKVSYNFFLGGNLTDSEQRLLEQEQKTYNDLILVPNANDSDHNSATIKALGIADELYNDDHVKEHNFVLMTTSETYVDLGRVISELRKHGDEGPKYVGTSTGIKRPSRRRSDSFYIPQDEYRFETYPAHHDKNGFAISWGLMKSMADCLPGDPTCAYRGFASCHVHSACTFRPIRFPDVTLGGIVMGATSSKEGPLDIDCIRDEQECEDRLNNYLMRTMVKLDNFVHTFDQKEICQLATRNGNPDPEMLPLVAGIKSASSMRRLHVLALALEEKDTAMIKHICGLGDL